MKRLSLSIIALLSLLTPAQAWENPGFEWEVGADITSAYLYRGMNYGGTTIQPEASIGYAGLALTAWANIGTEDNSFQAFAPELDIDISYSIVGLTLGVNHMYYFDGSRYFDFKGEGSTQTEVYAEYDFSEFFENVPLSIGWYTLVAGDDFDNDDNRAFSSYLELTYSASLPLGFYLTPTIGITPWKSVYTDYEGNFALNNLSLRAGWEYEVNDHFSLDLYAIGMLNTYQVNNSNAITPVSERYANQRLNGSIGIGIWFF